MYGSAISIFAAAAGLMLLGPAEVSRGVGASCMQAALTIALCLYGNSGSTFCGVLCRFQSTTAQVNTETNCLLSQVAAFLQKEQLPSALRSRLADRQQQPQGYGACKERQEQIHPASSNGTASFDFHFEFSTACSHELLVIYLAAVAAAAVAELQLH